MELCKRGKEGNTRSVVDPRVRAKGESENMIVLASCIASSALKVGTFERFNRGFN